MVEVVIYFTGLFLWFWFVPKFMAKDPSMFDKEMFEIKLLIIMGIAWPFWLFIMLVCAILSQLNVLLSKYIEFRTKVEEK